MCILHVAVSLEASSIWLMPNDDSCDPDEGEMDIMEMVGAVAHQGCSRLLLCVHCVCSGCVWR